MRTQLEVAPGRGTTWRPLTRSERLDDLPEQWGSKYADSLEFGVVMNNGPVPGEWRCCVTGLMHGPCRQYKLPDSPYCYYHDKLAHGVIDSLVDDRGNSVPARETYPVWPLPRGGYVLIEKEAA